MQIVSQFAPVSHTHFPPMLMLSAPRIAGLLPANVPNRPVSTEPRTFRVGLAPGQELFLTQNTEETQLDILQTFRTPDELDANLQAYMEGAQARYLETLEKYQPRMRRDS